MEIARRNNKASITGNYQLEAPGAFRFVQAPVPPIELQAMQMAYSELSGSNSSL